METIYNILRPTSDEHSHMVDAMCYSLIAEREARLMNEYVLLHIRQKPWWIPNVFYRWILSKLLVLNRFKT